MIYLIDDKILRQRDFGWIAEKFAHFSSIIKPLYKIEDITQIGEDLYIENNIILYHESFLDFTNDKNKALKQREKLTNIAAKSARLSVAFFSGSQGARSLKENVAYLPVSKLYQNLEILVQKHSQGSIELKYLLFGENPEIEEELNERLTQANRKIEEDAIELIGKTLFFHPDEDFIQNAIKEAQTEEIYSEKDFELSEMVLNLLSEKEYDNIFLPLCFGQTLSDYNGLRLATHVRCTPTKNQLKRIFIYGFVGLDSLLEHEYFNILKTKNIQLVSYSKKAFGTAANNYFESFKQEELSIEIAKLKLDPPLNYADSHSIANEWAIHQWAKTIGCSETEELKKVFQNVEYNLYFKYLRTIHPIFEQDIISETKLKINYEGKPKVLLIDDEAEKGWNEIFAFLLGDLNNIYTDYLGEDFKSLTSDEIIEKSIDKIFTDDIDVVILDFRLNPSDFEKIKLDEITSIKLLKEIKKVNRGVQVIIFSATNKIWNYQAVQEAGADGFTLKKSPESWLNEDFEIKSINNLKEQVTACLERSYIKEFYTTLKNLQDSLLPRRARTSSHPLPESFVNQYLKWLEFGINNIANNNSKLNYPPTFIMFFSVLENLSNFIIDIDNPKESIITGEFNHEFRKSSVFLKYFRKDGNDHYSKTSSNNISKSKHINWDQKILNTIDYLGSDIIRFNVLLKKRNDIIHSNTTTGDIILVDINDIKTLFKLVTSNINSNL